MPSFNLKTSIVVLFAAHHLAIAAPAPTNSKQLNNAYSGSGGNASGGHVYASESDNDVRTSLLAGIVGKGGLRGLGLNVLSNNAGDGGHANSGPAVSSPERGTTSVKFRGGSRYGHGNNDSNDSIGNAFSGAGGNASGESVHGSSGLVNVLSNNAGDGGEANSGSAGFRNSESGPRRLSSRIMRPRFL